MYPWDCGSPHCGAEFSNVRALACSKVEFSVWWGPSLSSAALHLSLHLPVPQNPLCHTGTVERLNETIHERYLVQCAVHSSSLVNIGSLVMVMVMIS